MERKGKICIYHRGIESKISLKEREQNSYLSFYKEGHTHQHKTKAISAFLFQTIQNYQLH